MKTFKYNATLAGSTIFQWMPTFHQNPVAESKTAVFLHAIQALTKSELNISDASELTRFKAVMVLLTHKLLTQREVWEDEYLEFIHKLIVREAKHNTAAHFAHFVKLLQKAEAKVYLPSDAILPKLETTGEVTEYHNLPALQAAITALNYKNQIAEPVARFNLYTHIAQLNAINELNPGKIYQDIFAWYGLPEIFRDDLIRLQKKYLRFHNAYFADLDDTAKHIETLIPGFNTGYFFKTYHHALALVNKNITNYSLAFLVELNLQQARKPTLQLAIHQQLHEIYLPQASNITSAEIANHTIASDSVAQIIEKAYGLIHPVIYPNIYDNNYLVQIKHASLFHAQIIPGTITTENAATLAASLVHDAASLKNQAQHKSVHQAAFENLSTNPNGNIQHEDKVRAREMFKEKLTAATTVEEIAALIATTKPHIDRHRSSMWLGMTNSWLTAFNAARDKSLKLLTENHTQPHRYHFWQRQHLFAQPLTVVEQIFGTTAAQVEINKRRLG